LLLCLIPARLIYRKTGREVAAPYYQGGHKSLETQLAGLILLSAILFFPTLFPGKIGWLTSLVPLPVFYYLVVFKKRAGSTLLRNAILLAAGGSLLIGSLPTLLFSLTMVAPGIAFSYALFKRKSPVEAGLMGSLVLALSWLLFWFGLGTLHQTNPYASLLLELDKGLSNGLVLYEESAELAPETLESVRRAVELLKVYIPKILPALMISAILSTTWLNLSLGNWLLRKKDKELTPWPDYKEWKLPEPLVWLVVFAGVTILLLPSPLSTIGLNGLIVCMTLYFFQGLAIAANLLNRWSVPRLLRLLIYALIFIQTYGIILLSFLGLADVWADFRKLKQTGDDNNSSI